MTDVARILERSEASCRQLASRARRAVRTDAPAPAAVPDAHARLLSAFAAAVQSGDVSRLAALLHDDAIAFTDGGGRKRSALRPIYGPDRISRFFVGLGRKLAREGTDVRLVPTTVNGELGALVFMNGELDQVMSCAIRGDRISALYVVRNPDKLRWAPHPPTGLRRHRIGQRPAGEERRKVGDHAVLHAQMRRGGMAAEMRGEHHVGQRGQRVRAMRLGLVDVEAGRADRLLGERRGQRGLIDHRAARDVDQGAAGSQPLQHRRVDDVVGVRAGPHRDDENVAPRDEGGERVLIGVGHVVAAAAMVAHLGFEGRGPRRDLAADLSHSVDADPGAGQSARRAHGRRRRCRDPAAVANVVIGRHQPPLDGQQQRHGQIGDRGGVRRRTVADHDVARPRRREIDAVIAGAVADDRAAARASRP